jgi:hypothetical protein
MRPTSKSPTLHAPAPPGTFPIPYVWNLYGPVGKQNPGHQQMQPGLLPSAHANLNCVPIRPSAALFREPGLPRGALSRLRQASPRLRPDAAYGPGSAGPASSQGSAQAPFLATTTNYTTGLAKKWVWSSATSQWLHLEVGLSPTQTAGSYWNQRFADAWPDERVSHGAEDVTWCARCNLRVNSAKQMETHIAGKRHAESNARGKTPGGRCWRHARGKTPAGRRCWRDAQDLVEEEAPAARGDAVRSC